jgi:hypothetical protein
MANGNSGKLQVGFETSYGVADIPEIQVRFSSEGFKYSPEKKEEGLLTGGIGSGKKFTTGVRAEGSLSTNVRPDEVGYWLSLALGEEDTPELVDGSTDVWKHIFIPVGNGLADSLPAATVIVDRIVETFAYIGMKVSDFSFTAAPGDILKIDVNMNGKNEETGSLDPVLIPSALQPFRFYQGAVKVAGTTIADVTNIKFDYNNNLEADLQTTSTGLYYKEPEPGMRAVSMAIDVLYTVSTEALKSYLKDDSDLSVEITFTSSEEVETGFPYSLKILVPHAQLNGSDANISGADRLQQSLTLDAIEVQPDEYLVVELVNDHNTVYV